MINFRGGRGGRERSGLISQYIRGCPPTCIMCVLRRAKRAKALHLPPLRSAPRARRLVVLKNISGILEVAFTLPCGIIVRISLPFQKVLCPSSEFPVPNYGFYFVFFAIRVVNRGWCRALSGLGECILSEEACIKGIVNTTQKPWGRKIEPESDIFDGFNNSEWSTELGHEFSGLCMCLQV